MNSVFEKQLSQTLDGTDLKIGTKYEGKVRDSYITDDGRRILVATDRISALGPLLQFKAMQSRQRVEAPKKAGIPFSSPCVGLGLLDTGAGCSALDRGLIASLRLISMFAVCLILLGWGSWLDFGLVTCLLLGKPDQGLSHFK